MLRRRGRARRRRVRGLVRARRRCSGRALIAQVIAVGVALTAGTIAYAAPCIALRIPEARQIVQLIGSRIGRRRPPAS